MPTTKPHSLIRLIVIIGGLVLCVGLVRSLAGNLWKIDQVEERKEVLQKELTKHEELETKLREATSAAFIEKEAREKLGLAREGETIVLMGKKDAADTSGAHQNAVDTQATGWKVWWSLFF